MSGAPPVTYLILSHTKPEQVLRLARVLRASSAGSVVLHHDVRRCEVDRSELGRLGVQVVEPPSAANWGEISLLSTVLRSLRWCLERTDFEWLVLLSGQDYPIRPIGEIERSLCAAQVDAFIETRPCPRPRLREPVDEWAGRYHFRWRRAESDRALRLARSFSGRGRFARIRPLPSGTWIGIRGLRSPFNQQLTCQTGSDWFTLSRRAVSIVDEFVRARPEILRYYTRTLHPSESFIHTVLANDSSLRLSGDCRRFVSWSSPHQTGPRVLEMSDLESMLASGCDFARKFDLAADAAVVGELDRRLHPG